MPVKCQRDLTQFLGVIILLKGASKKTFKVKINKKKMQLGIFERESLLK